MVSAVTARKYYSTKKISLMKDVGEGVIPCGIPYMFASLKSPDDNRAGDAALIKNNIDVIVDEAISVDRQAKVVVTKKNNRYGYEKLILATGSLPIVPAIPGIDKKGVYPIYKDMAYLKNSIEEIKKTRSVLIIGGGFIGVEFADEVSKIGGLNTYLAEVLPNLLANSFDSEFSSVAEQTLESRGVNLLTGIRVEEVFGHDKVEGVRLSDGSQIPVDSIILGVGGGSEYETGN